MPEIITEGGTIELPYDVENPERLKAAVEMLMEELPEEMKGDFMSFWEQAYQPVVDEEPINGDIEASIIEEPVGPMEVAGGEVPM